MYKSINMYLFISELKISFLKISKKRQSVDRDRAEMQDLNSRQKLHSIFALLTQIRSGDEFVRRYIRRYIRIS